MHDFKFPSFLSFCSTTPTVRHAFREVFFAWARSVHPIIAHQPPLLFPQLGIIKQTHSQGHVPVNMSAITVFYIFAICQQASKPAKTNQPSNNHDPSLDTPQA